MTTNLRRLLWMCAITVGGIVLDRILAGDPYNREPHNDLIGRWVMGLVISLYVATFVFIKDRAPRLADAESRVTEAGENDHAETESTRVHAR